MKRQTATIERYHVWGTPHYCLALFNRGYEWTPKESPYSSLHRWIPDDKQGIEELKTVARSLGFTHIRFTGNWERMAKPKGGILKPRGKQC